jgi:NitT/TauT family transport system substrate-binding protein
MSALRRCLVLLAAGLLGLAPSVSRAADHINFVLPGPIELPSFAAFQLARYLGYYSDAGLDVALLSGRGGVDGATQVGAGNADMAEALGDAAIIVRSHNVPVRLVAVMGGGALTTFGVREDSGVKTLQDLKGKKVSVISFQDTTFYTLLGALATVGLTKNDVDIEALGASGVVQFLINGTVQACACIPEWIVAAQDANVKLTLLPASNYLPTLAQSILASDQIIKQRPDQVKRFVQATLKAWVKMRDDPIAGAKLYIEAVPAHKGEEATLAKVYTAYAKQVWGDQPIPGHIDPAAVTKVQDLLVKLDVIHGKSPVADLYTNEFVDAR